MESDRAAVGHSLWLHFEVDEHPFAAYFDAHQGYRLLTHRQMAMGQNPNHQAIPTRKGPKMGGEFTNPHQNGIDPKTVCTTTAKRPSARSPGPTSTLRCPWHWAASRRGREEMAVVVKTVLGSHFGVGEPPILVYFSVDWHVHWRYGILTPGQMSWFSSGMSQIHFARCVSLPI